MILKRVRAFACTFLFCTKAKEQYCKSHPADKTRLVLTIIGGNDKVNPSVNAYNITDIGKFQRFSYS